jgi:Tfp pilus assembly protein FimT
MLKIATRVQLAVTEVADRLVRRDSRRGLTLVEYVLGAAIIAVIALFLRNNLTSLANTMWSRIQAAL